jgi:hypothetical protein
MPDMECIPTGENIKPSSDITLDISVFKEAGHLGCDGLEPASAASATSATSRFVRVAAESRSVRLGDTKGCPMSARNVASQFGNDGSCNYKGLEGALFTRQKSVFASYT